MDITRGEMVDSELDTLVKRRDRERRKTEGERAREELYEASVRRHNAARDQERRAEWATFHRRQAARHRATLTDLVRFHEEAAAKLDVGGAV